MQPQLPDRRKLLIIAVVVLSVLSLVIALIALLTRIEDAKLSRPFATGIKYSKQINENTLYYFTGSAFASYDLNSRTTKGLTPFYALPIQVNDVVFSPKGALWHASTYAGTDSLYQTLKDNGLDPFYNYWWLFNFDTGKPTLIGNPDYDADVRQAIWQDEDTYIYSEKLPNQDKLQIMRADIGAAPVKIATINEKSKLVAASADRFVYVESQIARNTLMVHTVDSDRDTDLTAGYNVAGAIAAGPDGSVLLLANIGGQSNNQSGEAPQGDNEVARGQLLLYSPASGQIKKIEDKFSGNASWRFDSNQWIAAGFNTNNEYVVIFNEGENIKKLKVTLTNNLEYQAVGKDSRGPLVINPYGDMSYAGTQQVSGLPIAPDPVQMLRGAVQQDRFSMAYDSPNRTFNFYIISPPNKTGMDAALQYIRGKGIDPYQIKTKWYGANGPNF